jgi:hypothetical protein
MENRFFLTSPFVSMKMSSKAKEGGKGEKKGKRKKNFKKKK